jgi:Domain of unknown function (DUF4287)/Domain of unknown function (DUF5655)
MANSAKPNGMTKRQRKWFASVQASLESDTGKSLAQWVAIAKTCPETKPRARRDWLRQQHGLGQNRAAHVLSVAFPSDEGWDNPDKLRATLWTDPNGLAILEAIERLVTALPNTVSGQRKAFTAFSRKVQFASAKPLKGGGLVLGLAVPVSSDPRLGEPRSEGWSERLKAKLILADVAEVDASIADLLRQAWETS